MPGKDVVRRLSFTSRASSLQIGSGGSRHVKSFNYCCRTVCRRKKKTLSLQRSWLHHASVISCPFTDNNRNCLRHAHWTSRSLSVSKFWGLHLVASLFEAWGQSLCLGRGATWGFSETSQGLSTRKRREASISMTLVQKPVRPRFGELARPRGCQPRPGFHGL